MSERPEWERLQAERRKFQEQLLAMAVIVMSDDEILEGKPDLGFAKEGAWDDL